MINMKPHPHFSIAGIPDAQLHRGLHLGHRGARRLGHCLRRARVYQEVLPRHNSIMRLRDRGTKGVPSGCGTLFVDVKLKVLPLYKFLILKRNSYCNVNKRVSSTRWTTLYLHCQCHRRSRRAWPTSWSGAGASSRAWTSSQWQQWRPQSLHRHRCHF